MKKLILTILCVVFCVLVSVETESGVAQFVTGVTAVTVFVCVIVLWRSWHMSEDTAIRKFLEE